MNPRSYLLILLLPITLLGCASSGSGRSSAKPVFYPNATLNRVGEAKARDEAQACMARAQDAGLTPEESTNAVAHGAGKGAAVGGSAGAVAGAFKDKPNPTYRRFVQRCLTDKGFDVIGWN